ncbi:MAG: deoxyribose-phosphate aldolase [Bacteroidota bacterium]
MNNIHRFIEHTNLKPTIVAKDVDQIVSEAKDFSFLGICVPPFWVKKASREIGDADIQLVTVIGFPLGYQMAETKVAEIEMAIKTGVDELDVVMNISSFKTGLPWTKIEIAKFSKMAHDYGKLIKVIIETAYLTEGEILKAAKLCADAGVDFVKTSTGFAGKGAQPEHIKLLRENLPSNVGIKASGGIKTFNEAKSMIEAGADRIGTSSGIEIVQENENS